MGYIGLTRNEYQRKWRAANLDKARKYERRYARSSFGTRSIAEKRRLREYGIKPDEYNALILETGGYCSLCNRQSEPKGARALVLDHDHNTLEVRGIVCTRCNTLLGYLDQQIFGVEWLRNAEGYLKR